MTKAQKQSPSSNVITSLEEVRRQIEVLKKEEEELKSAVLASYQDKVNFLYSEKNEPFGTVRVAISETESLVFDTPKKVDWDQKGLESLKAEGAPVKVEYSVSETTYKELDEAGKAAFIPYRTVKPGKIAIKIERK